MKKNVAGQVVGAQVCSAADGSDFAGSVTVYVTGDGGTQATGSVGAGAGIVEAKRAYARMQTIIDGADTATTAQMRLAIKEIAHDIQHLIRAAVR